MNEKEYEKELKLLAEHARGYGYCIEDNGKYGIHFILVSGTIGASTRRVHGNLCLVMPLRPTIDLGRTCLDTWCDWSDAHILKILDHYRKLFDGKFDEGVEFCVSEDKKFLYIVHKLSPDTIDMAEVNVVMVKLARAKAVFNFAMVHMHNLPSL